MSTDICRLVCRHETNPGRKWTGNDVWEACISTPQGEEVLDSIIFKNPSYSPPLMEVFLRGAIQGLFGEEKKGGTHANEEKRARQEANFQLVTRLVKIGWEVVSSNGKDEVVMMKRVVP